MKYGQALYERSVAQWAPYNIDYNELKHLIREHTTKGQATAISIPGQPDHALVRFEEFFCGQLREQHERVDLFVRSKADEFRRRMVDYERKANKLIGDGEDLRETMRGRRGDRLARLETRIMRCGEDIRNLDRFVQAQSIGFRKILKKYKKWTGSSTLTPRTDEFLRSPKSFMQMDFEPLYKQYNNLIAYIREHSPIVSETSTPTTRSRGSRITLSRSPSSRGRVEQIKKKVEQRSQGYWNEYDNPSDEEQHADRYVVYVSPDAHDDEEWPGQAAWTKAVGWVGEKTRAPVARIRKFISPNHTEPEPQDEPARRPLLGDGMNGASRFGNPPRRLDSNTDLESNANGDGNSPSEDGRPDPVDDLFNPTHYPPGYATHYATFPSVADQHQRHQFNNHRDLLLSNASMGCFLAAYILLFVSGLLLATGRHKLRAEVDAGVLTGGIGAMVFGCIGAQCSAWRWENMSTLGRILVVLGGLTAVAVSVLELYVVMAQGML